MTNTKDKTAGEVLLLILLIVLFPTMNTRVHEISDAVNATALEQTAGILLPYGILFLIIMLCAVIAYDYMKGRR